MGRLHSWVEPALGRAGQGWAAGWAGGLKAAVPPEPHDSQDGTHQCPAALTMPSWWFPLGCRPAVHFARLYFGPTSHPRLRASLRLKGVQMAPLLGPRVTPVPWGLQRIGESRAVSEKGHSCGEASGRITGSQGPSLVGPRPALGGKDEAHPGWFASVRGGQDSMCRCAA